VYRRREPWYAGQYNYRTVVWTAGKSWFDSQKGHSFLASPHRYLSSGWHSSVTTDTEGFFCASKTAAV